MKARLFTDGGARGNPGPAAYAYVLEALSGERLDARGEPIGVATNNVAEYRALVAGLERAAELGVRELEVVSDSELLVKQMRGEYKVKSDALRELSLEAARLARRLDRVVYRAVRREQNELADALVNRVLDAGTAQRPPPVAVSLDHVVVAVTDWARSNAFYADVLGAELVERGPGWAYRFGHGQLNVHGPGVDARPLAREPVRPGNSDLCFAWPGAIEGAVAHLGRHGVPVEEGPVERDGARGRGRSVYFRDPDGTLLELIAYA